MADFDKIYLDGVAYDVKDSTARSSAETLTTEVADLTQDVADNATEIASVKGSIRRYKLLNLADYATAKGYTITRRQIPGEVLETFSGEITKLDVDGVYIPPNYEVYITSVVRWAGGIISGYDGQIIISSGGQLNLLFASFAPNRIEGVTFALVEQTDTTAVTAYIKASTYTYFVDCDVRGVANTTFISATGNVICRNCEFGATTNLSAAGSFSFLVGVSRLQNCTAGIRCDSPTNDTSFIFSDTRAGNKPPYYINCNIEIQSTAGHAVVINSASNIMTIIGCSMTASGGATAILINGDTASANVFNSYLSVHNQSASAVAMCLTTTAYLRMTGCIIYGNILATGDNNPTIAYFNSHLTACHINDNYSNSNKRLFITTSKAYITGCILNNCDISGVPDAQKSGNLTVT